MKAALLLGVLSAASLARAETCSGFENRLTALADQVQAMIDIVEAMQPPSGSSCGGIIGTSIQQGSFLGVLFTDGRSGHPDYSDKRYDSDWCCAQCKATTDCLFWSLQFAGILRCQLYAARPVANRPNNYDPPAFIFSQPLGVGVGANRISGRIPIEGSTWGAAAGTGENTYMVDTAKETPRSMEWAGYSGAHSTPVGGVAEGFETCNSIGPFKPNFNAGNGADNGHSITYFGRDAMECCSICVRNVGMDGTPNVKMDGAVNTWDGKSCHLWAYNYDYRRRHCRVRQDEYLYDGSTAITSIDLSAASGMYDFQMAAECAPLDTSGTTDRFYPDGTTPCIGFFTAMQWSTGVPWASNLMDLPIV